MAEANKEPVLRLQMFSQPRFLAAVRALIASVCDRLGWKLEEFRGYRVVMSYPPIPTVLILRYPLPERPG